MKNPRKTFPNPVVVALLFVFAISLFGQSSRVTTNKSSSSFIAPAQTLDFSGDHLPPHFAPVNADELYEAAKIIFVEPDKGEFETTAQYHERIAAISQKPLLHGLTANDDFAIVLRPLARSLSGVFSKRDDVMASDFVETAYDADSRLFSVSIPTSGGDNIAGWISAIHRSISYGSSYAGENDFGVRRTVQRINMNTLEVEFEEYDWLQPDIRDQAMGKNISLITDAAEAVRLSANVEVIVVGKLVAPFTSHLVERDGPTIDEQAPIDLTKTHRTLQVAIHQLLIADGSTGLILKRFSRHQHEEEFPLKVEIRGQNVPFSDARCQEHENSFRFDFLIVDYSVDGGAKKQGLLKDHPIQIEARRQVDISVPYCNAERIRVFLGGKPYKVSCEYQEQYIANSSKCTRIQLDGTEPSPQNRH